MKAAVLFKTKQKLKVVDIDLPNELFYGQVLVKIYYSGICGSQINEIDERKGKDKYLPHLLGHEGTGIVKKIGPGVTLFKPGDEVVLHWKKGAGIESISPKYNYKGKEINAGKVTTFNEMGIISENRLTKIPKNTDMKIATLLGCSISTGFGIINNDAKIKIGQSVIVFGLGSLGLSVGIGASFVSSIPIIGVDKFKKKLNFAKKFGFSNTFHSDDINFEEKIKKILKGKKADFVIDTTGNKKIIELAYELTANNGKTILAGVPNKKITIDSFPLHFDKILTGSHGGNIEPTRDIPNFLKAISINSYKLNDLITKEIALSEINNAINKIKNGFMGKILIKF